MHSLLYWGAKVLLSPQGNVAFRMPKGRRNKRYANKGHGYMQPVNVLAVLAASPKRRWQQRLSSIVLLRLWCSDIWSLHLWLVCAVQAVCEAVLCSQLSHLSCILCFKDQGRECFSDVLLGFCLAGIWWFHLYLLCYGNGLKDGGPGDLWQEVLPWRYLEPPGFLHCHGWVGQ